jgi:hypothetical protein
VESVEAVVVEGAGLSHGGLSARTAGPLRRKTRTIPITCEVGIDRSGEMWLMATARRMSRRCASSECATWDWPSEVIDVEDQRGWIGISGLKY